nr:hypothetical protein [Mesorhizobium sp. BR1-1-6]
MGPTQPLYQQRVGEPGPASAWKASALDGREGADRRSDSAVGRSKMRKLVCQVGRRLVIPGKPQGIENSDDARLVRRSSAGRVASQRQANSAGGTDVVSRSRQQNGITKCRFIVYTPHLPRRCRRRRKFFDENCSFFNLFRPRLTTFDQHIRSKTSQNNSNQAKTVGIRPPR